MSRPVGRHRAPRATGFGALRRPAVAATAAISTVSVAGAVYSTTTSANAAVAGTAQAKLLIGPPATASSALQAADSGVVADGQAQADAAQQAVSARTAADAKSRSAAAKRATAATKLQHAAAASAKAAKSAAADKADKAAEAKRKAAAEKKAAAKKAAAKKAAEKKAGAKKAAATKREGASASRSSTRPTASFSGNPQAYASSMLPSYGWNQSQMGCLVSLWNRESGWRANASNPSSGAYGIPQSLPGTKMASAGADWRTNPATQIRWGLGYIKATYGSPCGAWGHSQATGWY